MHQETILLIDDEVSIRESLSSFLIDEGYRVFTAEDGDIGLDIYFREEIDIVLTDLRMPVMDGLEVMTAIHRHDPDVPMVVVSGAGKKQDVIKALQMGAKDYITKPITDLDMIGHVIEKALENRYLIRENRRYRRRLEKSEARYRTITEQIAEGVFTVDAVENLTFANPAFCKMLGYSQAELCSMNLVELATSDSFTHITRETLSIQKGLISRYEIQLISKNGTRVHVELACSPMYDDSNQYSGSIAVVRDITKLIELRKKYQKFLKREKSESKDILSICANCKNVRGDDETWKQVEEFFSHVVFSHGICPDCCEKLYPDIDINDLDDEDL
ncbi:MAG: response regulator [Desulfobacterales bacterium]|nr:response regulator [Desulfobacterales bacterium]